MKVDLPPRIELTRSETLDLTALLQAIEDQLAEAGIMVLSLQLREYIDLLETRLWPE